MLKRARASPGMRLTTGLPMSIEVNSRFEGSNRALPIGDVALCAGNDQCAVEGSAPTDLDGVAERRHIARLAQDAMIESFAALGRPFEQLHRSIHGDAFLIARDQK